jgi:EAL domain-containing protein (putative c-di-GMP-specific phosphodiesterase class I)
VAVAAVDTIDQITRMIERARFGSQTVGVFVVSIQRTGTGLAEDRADAAIDHARRSVERLLRPNDLVTQTDDSELTVVAAFDSASGSAPAGHEHDGAYEAALAFGRRLAIRPQLAEAFSTSVGGVVRSGSEAVEWSAHHVSHIVASAQSLAAEALGRKSRSLVTLDGVAPESLLHALTNALDGNELRLHLQPVMSLHDGRRCGFEALLRWQRPDHGLLAPDVFLEAATVGSLMAPIGAWVIEQAIKTLSQMTRVGVVAEREEIGINVVAAQLRDPDFPDHLADTLARHRVASHRIVIEITEQTLLGDDAPTASVLDRLAAMGSPIAIDDFGTGYSSLALLRRVPASILKIDRGFVTSLGGEPDVLDPASRRDPAIVRSVIGLARDLGMITVAEGIDQRHQAQWLRSHGCDRGQGWFLGLPVPASTLSANT